MLINPKRLNLVITQFSDRNDLIEELVDSPYEDKKRNYKLILAFWLGSNITLEQLKNIPNLPQAYIYVAYYCFLILDKQMNRFKSSELLLYEAFKDCFQELMACFNENYELFLSDPAAFFSKFKLIIQTLHRKELSQETQHVFLKTKQACLNELDRALTKQRKSVDKPLKETISIGILDSKMDDKWMKYRSKFYLPFYRSLPWDVYDRTVGLNTYRSVYKYYKIILPTKDGVLVDGLFLGRKGFRPKTIVLALVGHFPSEHDYIASGITSFQALFATDIVFINHRNYANRSSKLVVNHDDLKNDVLVFADYFMQKGKRIVLYGMCGGAAQMILAANDLTMKHIPYKLIVDRFPGKYEHFFDTKTLQRAHEYFDPPPRLLKTSLYISYALLFFFVMIVTKTILYVLGLGMDFSKLIQLIPENDLLILQAKSEKLPNRNEPKFTDLIVHPSNDIRTAIKDRRHHHKDILKSLLEDCQILSQSEILVIDIQPIFSQLAKHFQQCIELIENEKLKLDSPGDGVFDLHSHKLFELTTRNKLPISQFIQGFYKNPSHHCKNTINRLIPYSEECLLGALEACNANHDKAYDFHPMAQHLSQFLSTVKENEQFICSMGNRLNATGLGDLDGALQDLLKSALFQWMEHSTGEMGHLLSK